MKRGATILIAVACFSVLLTGYLAATYPTTVYRENIVIAVGYSERGIPTFKVSWPRDQVRVKLEVHESLAVWNITLRNSENGEVVWNYVGGTSGSVTLTSGWKETTGSITGTIRALGRFNATLTVETKGRPW